MLYSTFLAHKLPYHLIRTQNTLASHSIPPTQFMIINQRRRTIRKMHAHTLNSPKRTSPPLTIPPLTAHIGLGQINEPLACLEKPARRFEWSGLGLGGVGKKWAKTIDAANKSLTAAPCPITDYLYAQSGSERWRGPKPNAIIYYVGRVIKLYRVHTLYMAYTRVLSTSLCMHGVNGVNACSHQIDVYTRGKCAVF